MRSQLVVSAAILGVTIALSGCTGGEPKASETSVAEASASSEASDAASAAASDAPDPAASDAPDPAASGSATPVEKTDDEVAAVWPKEFMGNLPVPKGTVSNVTKMAGSAYINDGDTSTQPTLENVTIIEMSKEEALEYYKALKDTGATVVTDTNDDTGITLIGQPDGNTSFVFTYLPEERSATMSKSVAPAK